MAVIQEGIRTLIANGLVQIVVFALIFAISFGIMRKIRFLAPGEDKKKALEKARPIHTILSLVLGLLVLVPHYTARGSTYDIIPVITQALPQISLLLIGVLAALIILGFFGLSFVRGSENKGNPLKTIVFLITIIFVIYIFGSNLGLWNNPWANTFLSPDMVAVVLAILVFALIVSFVMGPKKVKKEEDKWKERLKDIFKEEKK